MRFVPIRSCNECSHRHGRTCGQVEQEILDPTTIPPFCPLATYPARTLADLERTITLLRENADSKSSLTIPQYVLFNIANKLRLLIGPRGEVSIPIKGWKELLLLLPDYFVSFDRRSGDITFLANEDAHYVVNIGEHVSINVSCDNKGNIVKGSTDDICWKNLAIDI